MKRAPEKSSCWLFKRPYARRTRKERPVTNAEMRHSLDAMLHWPGGPTLGDGPEPPRPSWTRKWMRWIA
jgi:hypothetical protein